MKMKVVIDSQTYQVEIEDIHARPVIAVVDGEQFEVWPEEEKTAPQDIVVPAEITVPDSKPAPSKTGLTPQSGGGKDVLSPLPGVIVAVNAEPGDDVKRGDELCTLEAMKMKNAIRSNRDGRIASIEINIGDQVNHGQVLMTFEE
jgi:biotin carboxyl carrier protein